MNGVKRLVAAVYSAAAARIYEPVIVHGTLPLFGGDVHGLIVEQGAAAAAAAAGRPILDMPVGTGYFAVRYAPRHGGIVVGVDIAAGMVAAADEAAAAAGAANVVAVQADAHRLPFPDRTFGAVVCANGLQIIPDLRRTAGELARVLAPGGRLVACMPLAPVARLLPPAAGARLPAFLRPVEDMAAALEAAGLRVEAVRRSRLVHFLEAAAPPRS